MEARIYPKLIKNKNYYYFQYTYREKINPKDSGAGPGSGKSKVHTHSEYLGSAESIRERLKKSRNKCVSIKHKSFGLPGAVYQIAQKLGMADILKKHIPGSRYGIPRYQFFLLSIINRIDHATSKEQMGKWADKTILPQLLHFNGDKLNSKHFWYVTDDVISESDLRLFRKEQKNNLDVFAGLNDEIFREIEKEIFAGAMGTLNIDPVAA